MTAPQPMTDDREAQASRVADYMEKHPGSTKKEIDSVCDTGSISKVISVMRKPLPAGLGYGITTGIRHVLCFDGTRSRKVRTYFLLYRPRTQPDLFDPT